MHRGFIWLAHLTGCRRLRWRHSARGGKNFYFPYSVNLKFTRPKKRNSLSDLNFEIHNFLLESVIAMAPKKSSQTTGVGLMTVKYDNEDLGSMLSS